MIGREFRAFPSQAALQALAECIDWESFGCVVAADKVVRRKTFPPNSRRRLPGGVKLGDIEHGDDFLVVNGIRMHPRQS